MKIVKTFLLLSFFVLSNTLQAQLEKGTIQLGVDGTSHLVIGDRFILEDWVFMPEASYFLFDNASIGLSGLYSNYSGAGSELTEYNVGFLSRYYFYQTGNFSLNLANYLGIGKVIGESETIESYNFKNNILKVGLGVGVNYHFASIFALSFSIRSNRDFPLDDSDGGINDPLDFRFGLRVNFNSSKK